VVDATPKRVGAANKARYDALGVKAIFQGGESHDLTGLSFVAQANYTQALGRTAARLVSCNTTGLVRMLGALREQSLLGSARAVLVRRATDPWESHKSGMINTLLPEPKVPSHQELDARTVLPDLDLVTVAAAGPFNLAHVHFLFVTVPRPTSRDEVLAALRSAPRIALVEAAAGVEAPNAVIEIARDLGRPAPMCGRSGCGPTLSPSTSGRSCSPTWSTTNRSSCPRTSTPSGPWLEPNLIRPHQSPRPTPASACARRCPDTRGTTMRKQRLKNGTCKVTFELPVQAGVAAAHLCGEFNDWSSTATPMTRRKDGSFRVTVALDPGRSYRFRYLLDGERWENDWAADDYVANEFGGDDSVVTT
jgi:hypothetical protein